MKRRLARELALKALFARDISGNEPITTLEQLVLEENVNDSTKNFALYLINGVVAHLAEIDKIIRQFAVEWELERMATVDRNIMRLALFEILYSDNVPEAVATNEAVELAKSYGSEESARFTNGILGNIIKHLPEIKKKVAKTEG